MKNNIKSFIDGEFAIKTKTKGEVNLLLLLLKNKGVKWANKKDLSVKVNFTGSNHFWIVEKNNYSGLVFLGKGFTEDLSVITTDLLKY